MTNRQLFLIACEWGKRTFVNPANIELTTWTHRTGIYVGFSDGYGRIFNVTLHRIQSVDSVIKTLDRDYAFAMLKDRGAAV